MLNVATFVANVFDGQLPFRVEAYDGSVAEPTVVSSANEMTLRILSRDAITRVLTHPGELGLARAYVAGDIDLDGDLDPFFELSLPPLRQLLNLNNVRSVLAVVGASALRPIAPPAVEARPRGALHSKNRDRESVTHHYDVSNRFYEMVLGPSMTYSCAVFAHAGDTLEQA
jgi:cyclopropane-fatty-acyl-phospholipid synthase